MHLAVGLVAVLLAFAWGQDAGVGLALGLVGASASVLGLRVLVWAMGQAAQSPRGAPVPTALALLALPLKLAVFLGCGWAALDLGGLGPPGFLLGVGLVYCLTILWAQAQH